MTDARSLRDELEQTQVALRQARAQLARPIEVERITAEVARRLEALGEERARLQAELRAVDGLRSRAEEAALRLKLARSSSWNTRGTIEVLVALVLVAACARAGAGLASTFAAPAWVAALVGVVAYPVIFFDAVRLTHWARRVPSPPARLRLPALRGLGWATVLGLTIAVALPFVPEWLAARAAARPQLKWDRAPTPDTLSDADYRAQYALDAPALAEATERIENKDFAAARDLLHRCTDERPTSVECHRMLGVYYGKFFQTEEAEEELRLFLRYAPLSHPRYEEAAQLIEYLAVRPDRVRSPYHRRRFPSE